MSQAPSKGLHDQYQGNHAKMSQSPNQAVPRRWSHLNNEKKKKKNWPVNKVIRCEPSFARVPKSGGAGAVQERAGTRSRDRMYGGADTRLYRQELMAIEVAAQKTRICVRERVGSNYFFHERLSSCGRTMLDTGMMLAVLIDKID